MKITKTIIIIFLFSITLACATAGSSERQLRNIQTAEAHKNVGIAFLESREFANALRELQKAYDILRDDPLLLNSIALSYKGLRNNEKAEEFFQKALKIAPDYYDTYTNLASFYIDQNRPERAKQYLLQLLSFNNYSTPEFAHYNLAMILIREDNKNLAIEHLKNAIDKAPDFLHAYIQLGLLYRDTNRYELALKTFEDALRIQPNIPQVLYNMAIVYEMQDNTEKAKELYNTALDNPSCPESLARNIRRRLIRLEDTSSIIP